MSSTTHCLDVDMPPYTWTGDYTPILKFGDIPLIKELRDLLSGKFRLVIKLTEIHSNLYVNGKPCLVRKRKNWPITIYPGTRILEGADTGYGGSNQYPNICFKEGYAIVEVITTGFPHLELRLYNMKVEVISLEKIDQP